MSGERVFRPTDSFKPITISADKRGLLQHSLLQRFQRGNHRPATVAENTTYRAGMRAAFLEVYQSSYAPMRGPLLESHRHAFLGVSWK